MLLDFGLSCPAHYPDLLAEVLRKAVTHSLGVRPGARLACVTVISPSETSYTEGDRSESQVHRRHLTVMMQWAKSLDLIGHQTSYHVLESYDVAQSLTRLHTPNYDEGAKSYSIVSQVSAPSSRRIRKLPRMSGSKFRMLTPS